jgi:two-component system sensor histidine kinase DegS
LHNVVKHAGASEAFISLATGDRSFTLIIRDNGKGFVLKVPPTPKPNEPIRPARGNGLLNMQQRLQKLGGRCEIKSAPGEGTEVLLLVPVAVTKA